MSQTKILDLPEKNVKVKPDAGLEEEIESLSTELGRNTRKDKDEAQKGLTKESGQKDKQNKTIQKKSAKPQPPPTLVVTPKDKVRAPINNNNTKSTLRKILNDSSSDDEMGQPGFSCSTPPKKRVRLVTCTPVMSDKKQRGSGAKPTRGREDRGTGRGGRDRRGKGGPGGSREVSSSKSAKGTNGSQGKC